MADGADTGTGELTVAAAPPDRASRNAFLQAAVLLHGPALARYFASRVPDASDAQDLVQEVYLRLLKLERPDLIRCTQAYVYTVAANIAREHWLKRSAQPAHITLDDTAGEAEFAHAHVAGTPDPADAVAAHERLDRLAQLLEQLSPKVRAALIWAHRDGHTYSEISERLSVPTHRVKKYLARALVFCRAHSPQLLET